RRHASPLLWPDTRRSLATDPGGISNRLRSREGRRMSRQRHDNQERDEGQRGDRLQRVLAQRGVASRRASEELITEGRVQVNGKVVTELGTRVDPVRDEIRVDGKTVRR